MSDHPFKKIIGFLNGLDYHSEEKNKEGHTVIRKSFTTYLLRNGCSESDIIKCVKMLTEHGKLKMNDDFMTSSSDEIGCLFGWIDSNKLPIPNAN